MSLSQRGNRGMAARKAAVFLAGLLVAVVGLSEAPQLEGGYVTDGLAAGPEDAPGVGSGALTVHDTDIGAGQATPPGPAADKLDNVDGTLQGNGSPAYRFPWTTVTTDTQMAGNNGYVADGESLLTLTLPASASLNVGDTIGVSGTGPGGWKIAQKPGQSILTGPLQIPDDSGTWTASGPSRQWICMASSADGSKLVACVAGGDGGSLYTSPDSGATWTERSVHRWWCDVASSADGSKLVAVSSGYIYTSSDSGVTWTQRGTSQSWGSVASSADGTRLVATWDTDLYVSTDSGATWTSKLHAWNGWGQAAMSADGMKIAVCTTYDYGAGYLIHVSSDGGETWTYNNGNPVRWRDIAMSADGAKLVTCAWPGQISVSSDAGMTWTLHGSVSNWHAVAASADGAKMVAHDDNGYVYFSTDSGVTWTPRGGKHGIPDCALVMSADGAKAAFCQCDGGIYTLNTNGAMVAQTVAEPEGRISDDAGASVELQQEGNDVLRVLGGERPQPHQTESESSRARADGHCVTDWLVAGPLDEDAYLDELAGLVGDVRVAPREGELLAAGGVRWNRYLGEGNVINLREVAGFGESVTAAAYCEFDSDADQSGHIHCVSQNALLLWLNGNLVYERPEVPYEPLKWAECGVELRRGANACLVLCHGTIDAELPGFALRIDGPEVTPPQRLVWNPMVPGRPFVEDGRYVLLSPDWRWMEGDDPAWADPGFDDSKWKTPTWPTIEPTPDPGVVYWMRVRGQFAPESTLVPYAFVGMDAQDMEVYLDGTRIHGKSRADSLLDPFHYRDTTVGLPRGECTLAVRVVGAGPWHPVARLAVRRADKAMSEELRVLQPRKHHRLFLVFLLASSLVYYLLVYRNHPRQIEGTVCMVTVTLAIVSMLLSTRDSWTFTHKLPMVAWSSPLLAGVTYIVGIAMIHVMARGAVSWRPVFGYGVVSVVLFRGGWLLDTRWVAFSPFPLMALEYVRVWIMYDLVPRRPNRGYVGIGLLFFLAGETVTALFGVSNGQYFPNIGPYAHLYGLIGLAACLVMYTSRESALGMHKLQGLTATLEEKVVERTQQVSLLTQQLITAEEAERERLSRELHDGVAQTLCYAKMAAEDRAPEALDGASKGGVVDLLDKAIEEVRALAYGLRPPELDKLGFVQAISQCCKDFSQLTGISLDYEARGVDNISLSRSAEVNLYRVLQEALNNVQQHAEASKVRVRLLGVFPSVILRVEDNGRGFDMAQQSEERRSRMGLLGMEERIRLIGGAMRIQSAPGEGVRAVFEIPQQGGQV